MDEFIYNIMLTYKQAWNHHVRGLGCWCKPIVGAAGMFHRNYVWDGERWNAIKEPICSRSTKS